MELKAESKKELFGRNTSYSLEASLKSLNKIRIFWCLQGLQADDLSIPKYGFSKQEVELLQKPELF